ncbi:MaoC family dehydratase [Cryptosporangium sp. NPDC048952]|uniref:MaoC family dehydratase n=1 Tax=Cryptosporangium sp. NPDC048952 TaxID=3363961 RepID=UPI0037125769
MRLVLEEVAVDRERLADYNRVCGFGLGDAVPGTYPQVLAFPLAIALMSEREFPFPLPGIVHIGNTITQLRPIAPTEGLTFEVHAENLRPHRRGRQFDIVTNARIDGAPIWHSTATYLHRSPTPADPTPAAADADSAGADARGAGMDAADARGAGMDAADARGAGMDAADARGAGMGAADAREGVEGVPAGVWSVGGETGREYARASGDWNPIHLHALSAKLFGFPRAIAHGMWVKARCLAALQGRLPDAYTITVQFGKPLLLPSTVDFSAHPRANGWDLTVANNLTGRVEPAPANATPHPE